MVFGLIRRGFSYCGR